MKAATCICVLAMTGALALSSLALATPREAYQVPASPMEGAGTVQGSLSGAPKSGVAQTLGARATATATASLAGGFEIKESTVVYLLVRGNSLRDLNINTTTYLDYPRVRIFNAQGQDMVADLNGNAGFNQCTSSNTAAAPVVDFYTNQRGQPPNPRDACAAFTFPPGVYTFGVQPSIPGVTVPVGYTASDVNFGDTLFEITLGPQAAAGNDNLAKTQLLVGGTWTYTYTIISTYNNKYQFTSIAGPDAQGLYLALGTDEYGDMVAGGYVPTTGSWAVLDPGIIIDRFYVFNFTDNNHVTGCYYQIDPPGSTNLSNCYSMTGSRYPQKETVAATVSAAERTMREAQMREEAQSSAGGSPPDPALVQRYLDLREALRP